MQGLKDVHVPRIMSNKRAQGEDSVYVFTRERNERSWVMTVKGHKTFEDSLKFGIAPGLTVR